MMILFFGQCLRFWFCSWDLIALSSCYIILGFGWIWVVAHVDPARLCAALYASPGNGPGQTWWVFSPNFSWEKHTMNQYIYIYVVKHMCQMDVVSSTCQFLLANIHSEFPEICQPWDPTCEIPCKDPVFGPCHMLSLNLSTCKSQGWIYRPTSWQMVETKGFFQPQWGLRAAKLRFPLTLMLRNPSPRPRQLLGINMGGLDTWSPSEPVAEILHWSTECNHRESQMPEIDQTVVAMSFKNSENSCYALRNVFG